MALLRPRSYVLLTVFCMLISLLAACNDQNTPNKNMTQGAQNTPSTPSAEKSASPAQTADNSTLTIGTNVDIPSFDFHNQNNGYVEGIFNNMFNYLVKRDNKGDIQPDLAEKFEKIDDVTWHFSLKKGVKFHNGDPLTSADVKFSLERVAKDNKLLQWDFYKQIQEVKIIDDTTFEIITVGPDPSLLNRLSRIGSGIFPKTYIETEGWDAFLKSPVGSGPYQFVDFSRSNQLVLKRFEDYFEGEVADWDQVVFRVIPEPSTRVGELLTGGVDLAVEVPPADWQRVEDHKGTEILEADSTEVMLLSVRSTEGPTADVRVRQAIDYAIDKQALIDNLLKGKATPTRSRVTQGIRDADESLFGQYRYDPEKAKQLLKEAGYENKLELTLQSSQGRYLLDTDVAQMIAGMLQAVGIKAKVEFLESSRYVDTWNSGKNKELWLQGRTNSMFDASLPLTDFYSKTNPKQIGYINPEVDELMEQAAYNMNEKERTEQYKRVQQIVADEVPYIYLYLSKYFTGANTDRLSYEPRMDKALLIRDIKKK